MCPWRFSVDGRDPDLLRWLKRGDVRLLLPADPGPDQMLGDVRLFDPGAAGLAL